MIGESDSQSALLRDLSDAGFRGTLERDVPLAPLTAYIIGGPAAVLAEIPTRTDLRLLMERLGRHPVPLMLLGAGTNVLISDDGFPGIAARLTGDFARMRVVEVTIEAGAAVPLVDVVREGCRIGLAGIERLAGIPGWVGGALAMNAGTYEKHINGLLESVDILTKDNEIVTLPPHECDFDYRSSRFQESGEIILGCRLSGKEGVPATLATEVQRRLDRRRRTQPVDLPSCGCAFKNPPGCRAAAQLIHEVGLKGTSRGGAAISDLHANYIVNIGGATASDILALMALVRRKVRDLTGVTLEPEVHAYGFPEPLEVMLDAWTEDPASGANP